MDTIEEIHSGGVSGWQIVQLAKALLSSPTLVSIGILLISVFALASALVAQYAFQMVPCPLCLLQRIPYAAAAVLGFAALVLARLHMPRGSAFIILTSAVFFAVNAAIAFYHNGVEQHWWASAIEGCKVPLKPENAATLLEKIQALAPARCDEIPWRDPILHLSMAAWNIFICAGLAVVSVTASVLILRKRGAATI
jgi:disulfide bond formation protein DsbB